MLNNTNKFQVMMVLYSIPEVVDQISVCQRKIKGKGLTDLLQPFIARTFDEFMCGVDIA